MAEPQTLIDSVNNINTRTVQVLAFHPLNPTYTLWVHNLLETVTVYIPRYGNTAKPPGWGHGGGRQEPEEIECLRERDSQHPILVNEYISEEDRAIAACGLREFRDESGYQDISIITVPRLEDGKGGAPATVRLYDYCLMDIDEDGDKTMHEIVTLWGEVTSLVRRPIHEIDEVDKSEWIDVSRPLCEIFRDRIAMPGFPYWSHVRRTIIGIQRIDWLRRSLSDEPEKCIGHLIHPSWRLVFPVGRGDARFPKNGFRVPPSQWYYLVEMMIQEQIDIVGANILYELFKDDVQRVLERENSREKQAEKLPVEKPIPRDLPEAEDDEIFDHRSGELTSEELLNRQDREYCEWMERELRIMGLWEDPE